MLKGLKQYVPYQREQRRALGFAHQAQLEHAIVRATRR